jgi:hypothetical protein
MIIPKLRLWIKSKLQKVTYGSQSFTWKNHPYHYFVHSYNYTWLNERAVEVPLVWPAVQQQYQAGHSGAVLEIGNVLSHYFPTHHTVVDKYEVAAGVINRDIVDFQPHQKYRLIVAISTLEHVGWDEEPRDKAKFGKAIAHLQTLLESGGKLLITVPLGYSPYCDAYLNSVASQKLTWTALQRVDAANRWRQVPITKRLLQKARYNEPFPNANVVLVGEYTK